MASTITSDTTQYMQPRSVLEVDKSTETFSSQVKEICQILGIGLEVPKYSFFFDENFGQQHPNYRGPREEWALRWLLKKLHAANLEHGSPCLEYRSWLLLRELVLLTSLSNTARLLSTHDFIGLLHKTLTWLYEHADEMTDYLNPHSEDSLAIADSSSTTVEVPSIKVTAKSRKRKRGDYQHITSNRSFGILSDCEILYLSIFSAVIQLQKLFVDLPGTRQGFAVEHLKSVFRGSREQKAAILRSSVLLANNVLNKESKVSVEDVARGLEICMRSVVEIWDSPSNTSDDASGVDSNQVFSNRCLMAVLYLLTTCKALESSYPIPNTLFKVLEDILVKNVLLPARSFSLNSSSSSKAHLKELSSSPFQDLLAPLKKTYYTEANQTSSRKSTCLALSPISLLFSIAVQCLPRNTPKQRSLEDSWLQNLFSRLVQYASMSNGASKLAPLSEIYVLTLNQMLQVIDEHNIRLPAFKLKTLLFEVSEALDGKTDTPDYWNLISLCIKVDASIFMNTSSITVDGRDNKARKPNEQLESLLSIITTTGWSTSIDTISDYSTKLEQFILPLAKAFAEARDLIGFILIWQQQLDICQRTRPLVKFVASITNHARSIWEDEKLLQLVARLIETSLTVGQIESLLQREIFNSASNRTAPINSETLADIIVLDCLTKTHLTESYLDQLTNFTCTTYTSILNIVSTATNWSSEHEWRLWRILNAFNEHWSMLQDSSECQFAEHQAVNKAVDVIKQITLATSSFKQDYAKVIYMFVFMFSLALASKKNETNLLVYSAIEILLGEAWVQHEKTVSNLPIQWDGQNHTIVSKEVAFLGCFSQLIAYPKIISNLKLESKLVVFRQLFWGAVNLKKFSQTVKREPVHYLSLWDTLLSSDVLREDRLLTNSFRDFQISIYIDAAGQKDDTHWTSESTDYELAFQSLQSTPVYAFKRNQRSQIFELVFNVIMRDSLLNSGLAVNHINLLAKHAETIHHSLSLLGKRQGDFLDHKFEGSSTDEIPLIGLMRKVEASYDSTPNYDLVIALKRLGEITLQCCTTLWKHEQDIEHLASFFQQIVQIFSHDLTGSKSKAASALYIVCLGFYANYIVNWPEKTTARFSDFSSFRLRHLESLCESMNLAIEKGEIQEEECRKVEITFEYMTLYADLLNSHSDQSKVLSQLSGIARIIRTGNSESSEHRPLDNDHVYVSLLKLEIVLRTMDGDMQSIFRATNILKSLQSRVEKDRLLQHIQDVIAGLSPVHKLELLQIFSKADDSTNFDSDHLLLLQRAISSQGNTNLNMNTEFRNKALSQIASALSQKLSQPTEFRYCMLAMQCTNILLRKEPRIISQWHIDNIIAAISIMSSHMRLRIHEPQTGISYIGLCRILNSILAIHRAKLGGRYHLVLPALRGLLQCLFIPYKKAEASSLRFNQESAIGEAHATAYSRLLTMICDPSVSAVTRSRKRDGRELNDEIKKARSIAGQHLQYLIMEYCDWQLKARLPTEVKRLLTPGIYAVFNVLSQDVMRTMNAAMNPSSRSIFKVLYGDYQRFGRWQQA